MSLLVSYDLEDNYLRQKVANHLIDTGLTRVQYSVYIGTLKDSVVTTLQDWIQALPQERRWKPKDSLILLSLTQNQVQQMLVIGQPKWDQDDLSGDQHTMMF